MEDILNKKSGVSGISGLAPDFRVIENASNEGNERARIAMENFKYSVASYIAKYAVAMNGIDYIVFTGGVGENQINIRKGICEKLQFMGVDLDVDANNMRGEEKMISKADSKVKVFVVPTNEELMIQANGPEILPKHQGAVSFLMWLGRTGNSHMSRGHCKVPVYHAPGHRDRKSVV